MRVAVIGAGPAGLSLASRIDADVYEEHSEVGLPRHCTSLVSGRSAEEVGIPPDTVLNKYNELLVTDLQGHWIWFKVRDGVYLLDRPGLERRLSEGVPSLKLGVRVEAIRGQYVYTSAGRRGPYDYVAIAEGAVRRFSHIYGEVTRLPGLQVDVKSDIGLSGITVVYNKKLSEAYFSWIVEIDRGVYRVGLADRCCVVDKLRKLVKIVGGTPIGKPFGGGVLAGPPLKRLVYGNVALLGDAAGLTKPLSGGGIILAIKSGASFGEALRTGDPSAYEYSMRPTILRLSAARAVYELMYVKGFVHEALRIFHGSEFLAIDYDDHVKTLALAMATSRKAPRALVGALRLLILRDADRPSM
ncbi:MAG: NAD(P)/FAD-dependent oxidoreductase [Thermoproteus sp.]